MKWVLFLTLFMFDAQNTSIDTIDIGQLGGKSFGDTKRSYDTKQQCESDLVKVLAFRKNDKISMAYDMNPAIGESDAKMLITNYPNGKDQLIQVITCVHITLDSLR